MEEEIDVVDSYAESEERESAEEGSELEENDGAQKRKRLQDEDEDEDEDVLLQVRRKKERVSDQSDEEASEQDLREYVKAVVLREKSRGEKVSNFLQDINVTICVVCIN